MDNSELRDRLQTIEELLCIIVAAIIFKPLGVVLLLGYFLRNAYDYLKGRDSKD